MKMSASTNDWCHICGERREELVDMHYPDNAEHQTKNTEYVRICLQCVLDAETVMVKARLQRRREIEKSRRDSRKAETG